MIGSLDSFVLNTALELLVLDHVNSCSSSVCASCLSKSLPTGSRHACAQFCLINHFVQLDSQNRISSRNIPIMKLLAAKFGEIQNKSKAVHAQPQF